MNKISSIEFTMERVMKELTMSNYEEYRKNFMDKYSNGFISTLELTEEDKNKNYIDFATALIEERLIFLSLNMKAIIDKINDDIIIIIEDFIHEVAIRFVLEVTSEDEVIEDSLMMEIETFISNNFDIKQIISNFSNIDKPKLNPVFREEYTPNMDMKENYMYNQAMVTKARKEFR